MSSPKTLAYSFLFDQNTDYGQDVLELAAMVSGLMDPNEVYTKIDINGKLAEIESKVRSIRREWLPTPDERADEKKREGRA